MLYDNHGRLINYMRLAVTDRCNLRCFYCMPAEGITYVPRQELMRYEELLRVVHLFAQEGISKIRITGGEPFLRKDLLYFLEAATQIEGIEKIRITTNATLLSGKIDTLKRLGIQELNVSLDSIDPDRFFAITRRNDLKTILSTLDDLLREGFDIKINAVVMDGKNIEDLIPLVELGKTHPIAVRFIEEMPFNGTKGQGNAHFWSHIDILNHIKATYPTLTKLKDPPFSTSANYQIKGFKGTFGIIAAYSRTFCGSCNRIRLTPQGLLKTCLYDAGVFNIRDLLRAGASDEQVLATLKTALGHRAKNGIEAEKQRLQFPVSESMATIGG